jgi:hypothetical protein
MISLRDIELQLLELRDFIDKLNTSGAVVNLSSEEQEILDELRINAENIRNLVFEADIILNKHKISFS